MTNEEAIKVLTNHRRFVFGDSEEDIAIIMAIRALQENPKLIEEVEKWKKYFEEELANEW